MSRPILMEKTPIYMSAVEQIHEHASAFSAHEPPGMAPLRPAYIVMWRPLCLSFLSSHFMEKVKVVSRRIKQGKEGTADFEAVLKSARADLSQAERVAALHKWAREVGARRHTCPFRSTLPNFHHFLYLFLSFVFFFIIVFALNQIALLL